jgi:hypothetical protein
MPGMPRVKMEVGADDQNLDAQIAMWSMTKNKSMGFIVLPIVELACLGSYPTYAQALSWVSSRLY